MMCSLCDKKRKRKVVKIDIKQNQLYANKMDQLICRVSEISESNREKYNKLKKKYICITWIIYIQYSAAIFYSKVVKSTRVCNQWSQEKRMPFINYGDMTSISASTLNDFFYQRANFPFCPSKHIWSKEWIH